MIILELKTKFKPNSFALLNLLKCRRQYMEAYLIFDTKNPIEKKKNKQKA